MSHALLALMMLNAAAERSAAVAPAELSDDAAISDAVEEVMAGAREAVRVALPPVAGTEPLRAVELERLLVRALVDRRREEVVSPAYLRVKLGAEATAEELRAFACDHVLLARVENADGRELVRLQLVFSETGEVLATASAPLATAAGKTTTTTSSARGVRGAVAVLVEDIAFAVESGGRELRFHRIAVTPFTADDAARAGRLDGYLESELVRALKRRGFLVVERQRLAAALNEQAVGQALDDADAPKLGLALGADSLVLGTVAAAGTVFSVSVRVVATDTGALLGAGAAELPRDDVVNLAAVEMRTPLEAGIRSAVAPGWGQSYNRDDAKALVFAIGGYGGLATTVGLGIGGALAHARYNDVAFFQKLPETERASAVLETKALGDALYLSALLAAGVTVTVWSLGIVDAIIEAPQSSSGLP